MASEPQLKTIAELMDGRTFFIPKYQRGYRWSDKQVEDLLRDLLCFAYDHPDKKGSFYCLQPVIVRRVERDGKEIWEVIDGQQRLTTIYILYKYLRDKKLKELEEEDENEEVGRDLYHIIYESRPDSGTFLDSLSKDTLNYDYIDFAHISRAYTYIPEWISDKENGGKKIDSSYKRNSGIRDIRDTLFKLLDSTSDTLENTVQVLWYELDSQSSDTHSAINEFQKINTGKIRLTDAELVKALFLMERNFNGATSFIRQPEIAMEWEMIENVLHDGSFWNFITSSETEYPNRIDFLFGLLYKADILKTIPEENWQKSVVLLDRNLSDPRQSEIFRFYYNKFEGKTGSDLQAVVYESWQDVMDLYRTLDDWYNSPLIYNLVGLLAQCGEDISMIYLHFQNMQEGTDRQQFINYLKERVRYQLRNVKTTDGKIETLYPSRDVFNILLAFNIQLMNNQIEKQESEPDGAFFKFPFSIFNSQHWDIEHIDSHQTNKLRTNEDKQEWIDAAMADLEEDLTDEDRIHLASIDLNAQIDYLKRVAKEEMDVEEKIKNSIGNLTLLDSHINRSYGNRLFRYKRKVIIEKTESGIYVPLATQKVFTKFFDNSEDKILKWSKNDMENYHQFIYTTIQDYLQKD